MCDELSRIIHLHGQVSLYLGPDTWRGMKVLSGAGSAHDSHDQENKDSQALTLLDKELERNPLLSVTQAAERVAARLSSRSPAVRSETVPDAPKK